MNKKLAIALLPLASVVSLAACSSGNTPAAVTTTVPASPTSSASTSTATSSTATSTASATTSSTQAEQSQAAQPQAPTQTTGSVRRKPAPQPTQTTAPATTPAPAQQSVIDAFAGSWVGHTRHMDITAGGRATEVVYSGVVHAQTITYTLQLRPMKPGETSTSARVVAVVTSAVAGPGREGVTAPLPKVDSSVVWTRSGDEIVFPGGTNYCDSTKNSRACGA